MFGPLLQRTRDFFAVQLPPMACEVAGKHLAVVKLDNRRAQLVEKYALAPLPENLIMPNPTAPMVNDVSVLQDQVKVLLGMAGVKNNRISLAIPDSAARLSIHHLDDFTGNEAEKRELICWKLKKNLPYDVEQGRLAFWEQKTLDGKFVVISVSVCKGILEQLEGALERVGLRAGYVTLSSLATLEVAFKVDPDYLRQTFLLFTVRPNDYSVLILERGGLVFYRQHNFTAPLFNGKKNGEPGGLSVAEKLYDAIHPCLVYYQDKYAEAAIENICLAASFPVGAATLAALEKQTGVPVAQLDPLKFFRSVDGNALEPAKQALIPSMGLALGKY